MLDQALAALRRHDYAAAEDIARARLAQAPDDADAHHVLGLARRGAGDFADALASLDRAVELAPEQPGYHLSRAAVLLTGEDIGQARLALGREVEANPNQLLAYIMLAHFALASGDLEEAGRQLALAKRVDSEHPHALIVEGNLEAARGRPDLALRLLGRALERAPEDPLAQSTLGLAYLAQGHAAFAAELLRKAVAQQPAAHGLRKSLASALLRQGHLPEALAEQETIVAERPDDLPARSRRAELCIRLGRLDDALADYRQIYRRSPEPGKALGAIVGLLGHRGQRQVARDLLESLLQESPREDLFWHALLELDQADPFSRNEIVRRWSAAIPESLLAQEAEARLAEAEGDLARARELAGRVCRDASLHPSAELIVLRAELGQDPGAALARAERLLAAAADDHGRRLALLWAGLAHDRLRQYPEATARWSEMLRYPVPGMPLPASRTPATTVETDGGPAPRLLWTLPGARADIVTALFGQLPCVLTTDRFAPVQRTDGLGVMAAVDEQGRPAPVLPTWRRLLAEYGQDPARLLEWIPHWDEWLAAELPGSRLLALVHDPRDLLLNMVVYGSPQRYRLTDFSATAAWLAQELEPLARRRERGDGEVMVLRGERLATDLPSLIAEAAEFLGIDVPDGFEFTAPEPLALGAVPHAFPDGHWRHYQDTLSGPLQTLAPLAGRLGD